MEISNSLLVAIMFVIILSLGIGNLLIGLAGVVDRRAELAINRIHAGWVILLLLVYFNIFWHTIDLLAVEEWSFEGFLYIVAGPILLFFASAIISPGGPADDTEADPLSGFFGVSRPFFLLLAVAQLWVIGTDLILAGGFQSASISNAIAAALFMILASTKGVGTHTVGLIAAWVLFLSASFLRASGAIT